MHTPTDTHLTQVEIFVGVRGRPSFDTWMFAELCLPALASTLKEIKAIAQPVVVFLIVVFIFILSILVLNNRLGRLFYILLFQDLAFRR